jgi:hypothetical protein
MHIDPSSPIRPATAVGEPARSHNHLVILKASSIHPDGRVELQVPLHIVTVRTVKVCEVPRRNAQSQAAFYFIQDGWLAVVPAGKAGT